MFNDVTPRGTYIIVSANDFAETIKSIFCEVLGAHDIGVNQVSVKETDVDLLTRRQACDLLGISLPTLSKYVSSGKLPCSRIGKKVLFDKTTLIDSLSVKGGKNG